MKTRTPKIITSQPGYSRGCSWVVRRAVTGGYRLYVLVGHTYMDASMQDVAGLEAYDGRSS